MTSPDGINWTARTAPEANTWRPIVYGNGLFVAAANTGTNRVMTSPDAINWTVRNVENSTWFASAYGNGLFVIVADSSSNRILTSSDGINWVANPAPEPNAWRSITFGKNQFVALSPDGTPGTNQVMTANCD